LILIHLRPRAIRTTLPPP